MLRKMLIGFLVPSYFSIGKMVKKRPHYRLKVRDRHLFFPDRITVNQRLGA